MQVHGSLCVFVWPSGTVAYADTKRFLKTLGPNSEWLALVEEVDAILARVSSTTGLGRVTVAPKVRGTFMNPGIVKLRLQRSCSPTFSQGGCYGAVYHTACLKIGCCMKASNLS